MKYLFLLLLCCVGCKEQATKAAIKSLPLGISVSNVKDKFGEPDSWYYSTSNKSIMYSVYGSNNNFCRVWFNNYRLFDTECVRN